MRKVIFSDGIVPGGGRFLTNDDPHNFAKLGREYLEDAKILCEAHKAEAPTWPTYQLAFQALENFLKASLLARGATAKHIKEKVGHNICKALTQAKAKGLKINGQAHSENAVMEMARDYATHDFRYHSIGQWQQVHPVVVVGYVEEVSKVVNY